MEKQAGRLYFIMEFVEGEDLQQLLFKTPRPLSETDTWEVIKQAASGLAHAAQHHIVHRDIKPANLILEQVNDVESRLPFRVRIADFGLARLNDRPQDVELTSQDTVLGSPRYMAPEQVLRQPVTSQADVFGLGVTAWEMFTGEKPFSGLDIMEIMREKTSNGLPSLNEVIGDYHEKTNQLIDWMLQQKPEDRPTPAELVQQITQLQQQLESSDSNSQLVLSEADQTFLFDKSPHTTHCCRQHF